MPAFDDSVRGTHPEDYQLLINGHVHFYRHRWALDRLQADLGSLGYVLITADLSSCKDPNAVRKAVISATPGWPEGYGRGSWAGFIDGLTDHLLNADRHQVVLTLACWGQAHRTRGTEAWALLDHLAGAGRWHLLFGRQLICLIENDDPDLELPAFGAEYAGWNRHEWFDRHRRGEIVPPWIEISGIEDDSLSPRTVIGTSAQPASQADACTA
ncbi:hypothetical protein Acy02nite_82370 [Actinoplanes cyaneus]|uniref:Uncharacterized protein n=1 Tax=Actinoplanes cyaneus TaxID=52696 RepID=A0A919MGL1_9ACTN|nr:hypothetical protein [Actinoplanes cyaneus]GID70356.1 hypothetical protein Acy02nite_82370 [Actinoplanes cyaneus]